MVMSFQSVGGTRCDRRRPAAQPMVPRYFFTALWRIKRVAVSPVRFAAPQTRRGAKA